MTPHSTSSLKQAQPSTTTSRLYTSIPSMTVLVLQVLATTILAQGSDKHIEHLSAQTPIQTALEALTKTEQDTNLKARCTQATCGTCSSSNPSNCYSCLSTYYLSSGYCYSCTYQCKSCSDFSNCSACSSGYDLSNGKCNYNGGASFNTDKAGEVIAEIVAATCAACIGLICKHCCRDEKPPTTSNIGQITHFKTDQKSDDENYAKDVSIQPPANPAVVHGRPTFSPGMSSMPGNIDELRTPLIIGQPSNRYAPPPNFEYIAMDSANSVPTYDYPRGSI
jgi:hypothetical protein